MSFDSSRGFGFLRPDDGGNDVFVHVNDADIDETLLREGRTFDFEITEGDRGPKAVDVRPTDADAPISAPTPASRPGEQSSDFDVDVFSTRELTAELTELLLSTSPTLTADQIVNIRRRLLGFAKTHGWLDN